MSFSSHADDERPRHDQARMNAVTYLFPRSGACRSKKGRQPGRSWLSVENGLRRSRAAPPQWQQTGFPSPWTATCASRARSRCMASCGSATSLRRWAAARTSSSTTRTQPAFYHVVLDSPSLNRRSSRLPHRRRSAAPQSLDGQRQRLARCTGPRVGRDDVAERGRGDLHGPLARAILIKAKGVASGGFVESPRGCAPLQAP